MIKTTFHDQTEFAVEMTQCAAPEAALTIHRGAVRVTRLYRSGRFGGGLKILSVQAGFIIEEGRRLELVELTREIGEIDSSPHGGEHNDKVYALAETIEKEIDAAAKEASLTVLAGLYQYEPPPRISHSDPATM